MSIAPPDTRRAMRPTVSNAIERLIKQQVCVTRLPRAQIEAWGAPADRTMTNHASHSVPRSLNIIELRDLVPPLNYPVELVEVIELMDGRRTVLRPVLPLDAAKLQAFVKALSPTSRYHRFMNGLRELPVTLLEKLTRIDYCSHMALVAEEQCDGIATIIGEARYVIDTSGEAAELAAVVADDWQGLGLARDVATLMQPRDGRRHRSFHRRDHGEQSLHSASRAQSRLFYLSRPRRRCAATGKRN